MTLEIRHNHEDKYILHPHGGPKNIFWISSVLTAWWWRLLQFIFRIKISQLLIHLQALLQDLHCGHMLARTQNHIKDASLHATDHLFYKLQTQFCHQYFCYLLWILRKRMNRHFSLVAQN